MCYLFTGMNVKVRDDVMTSKQPLVSTCLDESGQLLMLSVSPVFSGEISTRLLASLPDFVADGLADFFAGQDPVLLRIRCSLKSLTDWQQAILRAMTMIPRGRVISYAGLAALAGSSGAARAAGSACAANPLPLIFPCHRIIHSDGTPGSYMRQAAHPLKRRLLEMEGIELTAEGRIPKEYFL